MHNTLLPCLARRQAGYSLQAAYLTPDCFSPLQAGAPTIQRRCAAHLAQPSTRAAASLRGLMWLPLLARAQLAAVPLKLRLRQLDGFAPHLAGSGVSDTCTVQRKRDSMWVALIVQQVAGLMYKVMNADVRPSSNGCVP